MRTSYCLVIAVAMLLGADCATAAPAESEPVREADVGVPAAAEDQAAEAAEAVEAETVTQRRHSPRPAPPPPIGVRFGEPLEGQTFRAAYRFAREHRQGLMVADRDVSPSHVRDDLFGIYDRTPNSLEVTTHTIQLAYAPHPRTTLVFEVPILSRQLKTMDQFGALTQEQTQGIGDIGFALVVPFILKGKESSHFHVGFNAPTGSIRRGGDNSRLPFDLQPGNGTFDFEWGWTYRGEIGWLSWGGQALGWHPIGRNDLQYREGSRFETSIWSAIRLPAGLSASLRLAWQKRNNTRTANNEFVGGEINDPSDNPMARGGTRLSVSPGLALELPQLGNQRIAIEVGIPVHQDLDGPQLGQNWTFKAGWQWGF